MATIQQQAEKLVSLRASIKELEDNFERMITPLKAEKEALDVEMIQNLVANGFKSVKTDQATISIAERKTLRILDENKAIDDLKSKGLTDLYRTQIFKPLWKGYSEKLAKEGHSIAGTEVNTTTFISIRSVKKLN
jgi:hypothetical protein